MNEESQLEDLKRLIAITVSQIEARLREDLWVPRIQSDPAELDFRRHDRHAETGPWLCPCSTLRSSERSSCSGSSGVTTKNSPSKVVILRHEVAVLRRQVARQSLRPADRALLAGLGRLLSRAKPNQFFVQPEMLLRWHRDLVRRRWTYPHLPGRTSIPQGTVCLLGEPEPPKPFLPRVQIPCVGRRTWQIGVRASVSGGRGRGRVTPSVHQCDPSDEPMSRFQSRPRSPDYASRSDHRGWAGAES